MSHLSLHRRLEALRKALADRPPAPSGLSVNEELSRLNPERDAGLAVVAKRMREFDRYCCDCEPSDRHVTKFDEWVWFVGGFVNELWGNCGKCGAELEPYEPESIPLSEDPSAREFWDEYRSLVANSVLKKWKLERSLLGN